jgi:hypothetical protein
MPSWQLGKGLHAFDHYMEHPIPPLLLDRHCDDYSAKLQEHHPILSLTNSLLVGHATSAVDAHDHFWERTGIELPQKWSNYALRLWHLVKDKNLPQPITVREIISLISQLPKTQSAHFSAHQSLVASLAELDPQVGEDGTDVKTDKLTTAVDAPACAATEARPRH